MQIQRTRLPQGTHEVIIKEISETIYKNREYLIVTVERINDNMTHKLWIIRDSYLVDKLIDSCFKEYEDFKRIHFRHEDFIGKIVEIVLERNEKGYINTKDIRPIRKFYDYKSKGYKSEIQIIVKYPNIF